MNETDAEYYNATNYDEAIHTMNVGKFASMMTNQENIDSQEVKKKEHCPYMTSYLPFPSVLLPFLMNLLSWNVRGAGNPAKDV